MPSFDVVSQVDMQEVANALQQTRKEVEQRYDFKGSKTEIEQDKNAVKITSENDFKVKAVVDILQSKFVKRSINLKSLEYGKIEPAAGGAARQVITIHQGLDTDAAREVVKIIKDSKIKVQAQVQDDQVRVTGKKRDDLQDVIALLKKTEFELPLQFDNFRD